MLLSRRNLLKTAGTAAAALAALPLTNLTHLFAHDFDVNLYTMPQPGEPPTPLGRVADWQVQIRTEPKKNAPLVRAAKRDELLFLKEQVEGEAVMAHNSIWYKLDDGYAYSSFIQPVLQQLNQPEPEKATEKFWGEVTMPYADARVAPDPNAGRSARRYYTSVYRVTEAKQGVDGQWWYRLTDGVVFNPNGPFIPASHIRRLDPSELTPLHPEVENKRIEVDLAKQMLTAYEGDKVMMTSRTATGYGSFQTPKGTFRIIRKRMSSRMIGGEGSDRYDLPGVPFPSYFTVSAVAFHGAYWHNDFGRRRSHGCVNTPAEVARWIWRWTMPEMEYEATEIRTPRDAAATPVIVV
jgi:lipoprotein-anchoring transpeptidase ErfK/SrfK